MASADDQPRPDKRSADRSDRPGNPERSAKRVCVGAIAGAFGVRGEARIKAFTADPAAIGDYGPLESEDGARRFEVKVMRDVKGGLAVRLSGVATREDAEALKGVRLYVPREALPETLDEDEYYHADLLGMSVTDLAGRPLGRVKAVQNFGAGDVLEVTAPELKHAALLPFTREAAPHVDLARREIVADPPEGVFEWRDGKEPPAPNDDESTGRGHAPE